MKIVRQNMVKILLLLLVKLFCLLPPQGFGPEAKTRGGIFVVRAYIYNIRIPEKNSIGRCKLMAASMT